jgi:hypothetical protein
VSKSSEESKYLQREYSSQLIFHLRRQLVGTRKHKVLTALSDVSAIPSTDDLSSGIMALSRQWKCLLGVTDEEFRPAGLLKRPVVGRGVLTERDRAILMRTEYRKSQEEETLAAGNLNSFLFIHSATSILEDRSIMLVRGGGACVVVVRAWWWCVLVLRAGGAWWWCVLLLPAAGACCWWCVLLVVRAAVVRAAGGACWWCVLLVVRAGGGACCWWCVLLVVRAAGGACCWWRVLLVVRAAGGACCCWCVLLLVRAAAGACCCWCVLLLVRAAAGACCCCWCVLLLERAAAGACCCWCVLVRAAGDGACVVVVVVRACVRDGGAW